MNIHFIGIGGIGVSALARYYLAKGHKISGSDLVCSEITDGLRKEGAKLCIGKHRAENLSKNTDLVIFSPAITKDNPEIKRAKELGILVQSYPEALGELTKRYFTIAICGTHGKSTVTAMIGLILTKAGFDPTVILGTKLKEFGDSNCRVGKSEYLVIEADEHFASFLNYWPKIIVLTTLEPDHLDYYKNFKNYILAFKKFVSHLPKDGFLVANRDDKNIYSAFSRVAKNVKWYSLEDKETRKIKRVLKIPGEFNVANALAALKVAQFLKILEKTSLKTLSQYCGAWRRFEINHTKFLKSNHKSVRITIVSDYGHHPTEIKVTLRAGREKYPKKKIWCVFQPHQYQRTYYLFGDFVKVFKEVLVQKWVDKLIITDIYDVAGRENENIKTKINSQKLIQAINYKLHKRKAVVCHLCQVEYIPKISGVINYLKKNLEGGEVVIVMGAGDIYNLVKYL